MYVLKTDNLKPAVSDYLQLKIKEQIKSFCYLN